MLRGGRICDMRCDKKWVEELKRQFGILWGDNSRLVRSNDSCAFSVITPTVTSGSTSPPSAVWLMSFIMWTSRLQWRLIYEFANWYLLVFFCFLYSWSQSPSSNNWLLNAMKAVQRTKVEHCPKWTLTIMRENKKLRIRF